MLLCAEAGPVLALRVAQMQPAVAQPQQTCLRGPFRKRKRFSADEVCLQKCCLLGFEHLKKQELSNTELGVAALPRPVVRQQRKYDSH